MKQILPMIFIIIFCSQTWAQESRIIIGIDLTASTTNHWGNFNREYVDPIQGLYPGLNFEYMINDQFSLKSGLEFEKKGISYDATAYNISRTEKWNFNHSLYYEYISVPVLFSYSTQGVFHFYFSGGFYGGILLKRISEFYSERDNSTIIEELKDSSKKYDAGLSFGAGINKSLGRRMFVDLGVRNYLGIVDILIGDESEGGPLRTNSFGLVFAVNLKI